MKNIQYFSGLLKIFVVMLCCKGDKEQKHSKNCGQSEKA